MRSMLEEFAVFNNLSDIIVDEDVESLLCAFKDEAVAVLSSAVSPVSPLCSNFALRIYRHRMTQTPCLSYHLDRLISVNTPLQTFEPEQEPDRRPSRRRL